MQRQRRWQAKEEEAGSKNSGVTNGDIYSGSVASCFKGQFSLWAWKVFLISPRVSQGLELHLSAPPPERGPEKSPKWLDKPRAKFCKDTEEILKCSKTEKPQHFISKK